MIFDVFLNYDPVGSRFSSLEVLFQKEKADVRGRMQDRKVKLF
jgi:hypothetical protein